MRSIVLMALFILVAPHPASAQDYRQVQSCIWGCQGEHGAGTAAYEQCVESRCNDGPPLVTAKPASAWTVGTMNPADPPYLDGRSADSTSTDGSLELAYVCGRGQGAYFFLEGAALSRLVPSDPLVQAELAAELRVDGVRYAFPLHTYEGAWQADVPPHAPLIGALQRGSSATLNGPDGDLLAAFSLAGSAAAIASALAYCAS